MRLVSPTGIISSVGVPSNEAFDPHALFVDVAGALVVDAKFASRLTQGMYDFNKAQIGARRFAYKEGIKNISESIGSVMGNVFNE